MTSLPKDQPMYAFQALQTAFAGHIRNPETPIIAGIETRRMDIYKELFFNNIHGFTASAFPISKEIMGDTWWNTAVREFMIHHRCESPYFNQISAEFLAYITQVREKTPQEPDFLHELMHYEWVELALDIAEQDPFQDLDTLLHTEQALLEHHPLQSPLAWSLSYQYPVHQISKTFQPDARPEQPTWIIVYRNKADRVQFMTINAMTAQLLFILNEHENMSGEQALLTLAQQLQHPSPDALIQGGQALLKQLYDADILLGAQHRGEHL
jgi:hypothetical protein